MQETFLTRALSAESRDGDSLRCVEPIDFDDIDALNAACSSRFGPWGKEVVISQDLIAAFADLTGDRQWIHTDVERCRTESPFGAPVAHGFLVLSMMHQSMPRPIEVKGHKSAINYGAESLRFIAPVIAGSSIRARSRVVRAEATPKGTLITAQVEVGIVGQDKPALLYGLQVLYI
jgi:acyl dehydratase